MDIMLTLAQRHIDGIAAAFAYDFATKTEEQTDEEYAALKTKFAILKIVDFVEQHAAKTEMQTAEIAAAKAEAIEVAKRPKPVATADGKVI